MPGYEDEDSLGNPAPTTAQGGGRAGGGGFESAHEVAMVDIDEIANVLNVKVTSITKRFFRGGPAQQQAAVAYRRASRRASQKPSGDDLSDDEDLEGIGEPAPRHAHAHTHATPRHGPTDPLYRLSQERLAPGSGGSHPQHPPHHHHHHQPDTVGTFGSRNGSAGSPPHAPPSPTSDFTLSLAGSAEDEREPLVASGGEGGYDRAANGGGAVGTTSTSAALRNSFSAYASAASQRSGGGGVATAGLYGSGKGVPALEPLRLRQYSVDQGSNCAADPPYNYHYPQRYGEAESPPASPVTSIASGPSLMFPGEEDALGGGWVPIYSGNPSFASSAGAAAAAAAGDGEGDSASADEWGAVRRGGGGTSAPSVGGGVGPSTNFLTGIDRLLDKEARLPKGNALGNIAGSLQSWLQGAVPKLPTTTTMSIVQDSRGAHYGAIQRSKAKPPQQLQQHTPPAVRKSACSLPPNANTSMARGGPRGTAVGFPGYGSTGALGSGGGAGEQSRVRHSYGSNSLPPGGGLGVPGASIQSAAGGASCVGGGGGGGSGGTVPATQLKKKLNLPSLPSEVETVRLFRDPSDRNVYLTVVLNRPFLAWAILFISYLFQAAESFVYIRELRQVAEDGNSTDSIDNIFYHGVSLVDLWVMEILFLLMIVACFGAWVLGDFDDRRGNTYAMSRHGSLHVLLLVVFYGLYTVPWSKHTAQSGTITLMYILPPVFVVLAVFFHTQRMAFRPIFGIMFMMGGFSLGITLPDTDSARYNGSHVFSWLSVLLSSIGLVFAVYFAKQIRPHFPLPLLLLVVALGGAFSHAYFASESGLSFETIIVGFAERASYFQAAMGLASMRGVAAAGWLWSLMYLSPLSVAAPMVGQRLLALVALSFYEDDPQAPPVPMRLAALLLNVIGIVVLCSLDMRDKERTVCLTQPEGGQRGAGGGSFSQPQYGVVKKGERRSGSDRATQSCASLRSMKDSDECETPKE